jgi:hypothetical protein
MDAGGGAGAAGVWWCEELGDGTWCDLPNVELRRRDDDAVRNPRESKTGLDWGAVARVRRKMMDIRWESSSLLIEFVRCMIFLWAACSSILAFNAGRRSEREPKEGIG